MSWKLGEIETLEEMLRPEDESLFSSPTRKFPQGSIRARAGVIKSPQKKKLVWGNRVRRVKLDPTPFRTKTNKLKMAQKLKKSLVWSPPKKSIPE